MDNGFENEEEEGRQGEPGPQREALGEGGLADQRLVGGIEFAKRRGGFERAEIGLGVGEIDGGEGDGLAGDLPAIEAGHGGHLGLPQGAGGGGGLGERHGLGGRPEQRESASVGRIVRRPGQRAAGERIGRLGAAARTGAEEDFGDGRKERPLGRPIGLGGVQRQVPEQDRGMVGGTFQQGRDAVGEMGDGTDARLGGE